MALCLGSCSADDEEMASQLGQQTMVTPSFSLLSYSQSESTPVLKDGRDIEMWQYTGKGKLNGINGYVDKSRFMGRHKLREIRFRHR